MSFFSKPKIPKPAEPASTSSQQVQQAQLDARRRALLQRGRQSTLIASQPVGLGTVGQQATA